MPEPIKDGHLSVIDGWDSAIQFVRHQILTHFTARLHQTYNVTPDANGLPYSQSGFYLPGPTRVYSRLNPVPYNLRPVQEEVAIFVGPLQSARTEGDGGGRYLGMSGTKYGHLAQLPVGVAIMLTEGGHEPVRDDVEDDMGRTESMALADGDVFQGRLLDDFEILTRRTMFYAGVMHDVLETTCVNSPACRDAVVTSDMPVDLSVDIQNGDGQLEELNIQVILLQLNIEQHQYVGSPDP